MPTSPLNVAPLNVVGTIASDPSKSTPPIVRAVVSVPAVVAVAEFPLHAPAVVAEPAEPVVFWFRVGIRAASSVPDVILVALQCCKPRTTSRKRRRGHSTNNIEGCCRCGSFTDGNVMCGIDIVTHFLKPLGCG